ncbi:hypothetical protein [Tsukamurella spumae]|uniref:hypothetical protein n=1 Tax=Tsukamurella spumae TaxID=44753 RepID=UPI0031E442A3
MCEGQPYCLAPYVFFRDGEPVINTRISLTTRSGVRSVEGPFIVAEWLWDVGGWSCWTPCDFPTALEQLGIPLSVSEYVMEEVTERLVDSPQVSILLDDAQFLVELLPAPAVNPH